MEKFEKLVLCLLIIVISLFNVFAVDNTTLNNTNDSTDLKDSSKNAAVKPMSIIIWSFSASPNSVNLGTLYPDNSENSFPSVTTISITAWGSTDLYVRASGNLISTTNSANNIALSNLQYDGFKNSGLTKRSFTTSDVLVKSWNGFFISDTVPVNYYLRVPSGTEPGTYTVTIYYTAV
ncbi:hypothetical protein FGU46_09380 [Methanobacterium sp. CWC-01]|uniref:hypothetical protein n=1 Tax=Methanobacterium aridiramus TaxID=2584467 RepID=UPI002575F071|nr:hypothetical protein [Methanobacterium sp. CWC-01]WJI10282.1 hypothetical protein FGU46_09380 [Methanobacterium sp. CWC-01]